MSGKLARVWKSIRVAEIGVDHAQLVGLAGHQLGEIVLIADPQTWNPGVLPSVACIVKSVQADTEETLEELEQHYGDSYRELLYPAR